MMSLAGWVMFGVWLICPCAVLVLEVFRCLFSPFSTSTSVFLVLLFSIVRHIFDSGQSRYKYPSVVIAIAVALIVFDHVVDAVVCPVSSNSLDCDVVKLRLFVLNL